MLQPLHTRHSRVSTPAFQLRPGVCLSRKSDDHWTPLEAVRPELPWCTLISSGSSSPRTWLDTDQRNLPKMQMTWVLGSQHPFALEVSSCWDRLLANAEVATTRSPVVLAQLPLLCPWWQIEMRGLPKVFAWNIEYWIRYPSENCGNIFVYSDVVLSTTFQAFQCIQWAMISDAKGNWRHSVVVPCVKTN